MNLSKEQLGLLKWFGDPVRQYEYFSETRLKALAPPGYTASALKYLLELKFLECQQRIIKKGMWGPCYSISEAGAAFLAGLRHQQMQEKQEEKRHQEALNLSKREAFINFIGIALVLIVEFRFGIIEFISHLFG